MPNPTATPGPLNRRPKIKILPHARLRMAERAPGLDLRGLLTGFRSQIVPKLVPGAQRYALTDLCPQAIPVVQLPRPSGPLVVVTVLAPNHHTGSATVPLALRAH